MNRMRLAVVGLGIAFRELHLPALKAHRDEIEISAVFGTRSESVESAADLVEAAMDVRPFGSTDLGELTKTIADAVLVCVPISKTYELAKLVLQKGFDLVVEKPLGESAEEAAEVVKLAESLNLVLCVCENFRYQAGFLQANEMVGQGLIGDPKAYFLNDLHYTPPDGMYSVTPWRQGGDHRGGYILDGGSHIVAGLRQMVGDNPIKVHSLATSFHPEHLGAPWDTAFANMAFKGGIVGHLALGYGSPDREARHPKILGTEGTIVLKKTHIELWRPNAGSDEKFDLTSVTSGIPEEWVDFLPALHKTKDLKFSAWEAVKDLAVIDAILESAGQNCAVDVTQY